MEQSDIGEMLRKIADELGSEGDFGDEQNDGLVFGERASAELDIDVGFAGAGDAVKQDSIGGIIFDGINGLELGRTEGVVFDSDLCASRKLAMAFFGNAAREGGLNDGRKWTTIVLRNPENGVDEFLGEGLLVNNLVDGLGLKFGLCCIFYNDSDSFLFAERNLNNLADFEGIFASISQKII